MQNLCLLDKLTNAAMKMFSTPIVISTFLWLTLGKTFCRTLVFAFSILAKGDCSRQGELCETCKENGWIGRNSLKRTPRP